MIRKLFSKICAIGFAPVGQDKLDVIATDPKTNEQTPINTYQEYKEWYENIEITYSFRILTVRTKHMQYYFYWWPR